ncbi:MAG: beta-ketoacyl-[acyl-carrier-protein] synthase [Proteobacteria bacterium]|jgi:3-oxoacyl-[acyl-carrier-protein] synthase-1|nr:beta-ketoacyl-[acyl-carrier-protein] synthase [Pseudomonadota bacterium]
MAIKPLAIAACTLTNALGPGIAASLDALRRGESGLRPCDFEDVVLNTWIGRVAGLEEEPLRGEFAPFDCRNNRLARLGLEQDGFGAAVRQARDRYGPDRIGVFVGTSTSGIGATEQAYRQRDLITRSLPATFDYRHTHNVFSVADFTRRWLGLTGAAFAISTACSSSAKAFASAWRQMRAGFCDAAVVGGVDSLCLTTLYGFNALGLASTRPCRPWDVERDGLSVGEAAGFALLEWAEPGDDRVLLLGYGESSDAWHMTAAHPEGAGAALAMQQALARAEVLPAQVDYINLHGTATPLNDAAEDRAVVRVFGSDTPCSSTKGWTGHTLGAAGITEAIFVSLCLEQGLIPGTLNTRQRDPKLGAGLVLETRESPLRLALSNSFGFGGTNCSLLFGRRVRSPSPRVGEGRGEGVA